MKKPIEKFFIVAERHNPQIGTYLSDVYVGVRRNNKQSITCTFEYFGEKRSLRFSEYALYENKIHSCLNAGNCLYGSMSYYGFESAELAKAYLEKNWSKYYKFARCIEKLTA